MLSPRGVRERGSALAAIPVILIGLMLIVGFTQLAFLMQGRQMADFAAYRAHRAMEERRSSLEHKRNSARRQAEEACRLGYPEERSTVEVSTRTQRPGATVELKMEPLLGSSDILPMDSMKVKSEYPQRLENR